VVYLIACSGCLLSYVTMSGWIHCCRHSHSNRHMALLTQAMLTVLLTLPIAQYWAWRNSWSKILH